ncbi:MAG: ATP-binding protein [bacterium]
MLSILTFISIFTEIFAAGMLLSGAYVFFRRYLLENKKGDFFLSLIFGLVSFYSLGTLISQMMFNIGFSFSDLVIAQKIIAIIHLITIAFLWFFIAERFSFNKLKLLAYGISVFIAVLIALVFLSVVNLQYREGVIEPLVQFSYFIPVRSSLIISWLILGLLYIWSVRNAKSQGERNLELYCAIGSIGFVCAHALTYFYGLSGTAEYLLLCWVLILVSTILLLLGELIPPDSKIADFPLNFFRTRILFKLLIIFVLLIVILIESTVLIALQISRQAMYKSIVNREQLFAAEVGLRVDNMINDSLEQLIILSRTYQEMGNLRNVLGLILTSNPMLDAIAVLDANGNTAQLVSRTQLSDQERSDLSGRSLIAESLDKGSTIGDVTPGKNYEYLYTIAAVPLGKGGAITAKLNLSMVQSLIEDSRFDRKGIAYIVSKDGRLIAHPDKKRAMIMEDMMWVPIVGKVLMGTSGGEEYSDEYSHKRMVGAYVPLSKFGWGIIVEEPAFEAYFGIRQVETNTLILILMSIVIAIIVGVFFARYIEHSLKEVTEGTEAVARGDLHHKINVGSLDEIGELASAFNEMTKELRESQIQLIRSERLAALGTMAAGMAHEIKNPLVSLKTFTQLLTQRWEDPKFREKFATIVPASIDQINRITESLLKFGRPSKPEFKPIAVNDLLDEVLDLVNSQMDKTKIRSHKEYGDLPDITGDAGQIQQVFLNLILNAIQAMPNGGDVYVRTDAGEVVRVDEVSRREKDMGFSMLRGPRSKSQEESEPIPVVFIEIADSGTGIAEEHIKEMFDPFFTTKATGTGMGLPITLRIIEEHGGSLKVRSEVGKGTSFIITLPQKRI